MDGIVKTRCFLEQDISFKANEEDYRTLKEVWLNIIRSWLNPAQIKNINVGDRIFYLPENCQYIYWKLCEQKKPLNRDEIEEIALKAMTKLEYYEAWNVLIDMGVIFEHDGIARPHFVSEIKDGEQSRL
jgi:hypothetical protein